MHHDKEKDISYLEFDAAKPYTLNEGENKIYIRTVCYNGEFEQNSAEKFISDPVMVIIELDKSLAEYDIEYGPRDRTNKDITATLTINNRSNKTYEVISENPNVIVNKINNEEYELIIKDSVNTVVKIEDNLGNATLAEVYVDWIDKKAPVAELESCNTIEAGERTDGEVKLKIEDTVPYLTQFALMDHEGEPDEADFERFENLMKENKTKISVIPSDKDYGEVDENYTIIIRGITGTYWLGYKSSDTLGNEISAIIPGTKMILNDAQIDLVNVSFDPKITKSSTVGTLKFNVPVSILSDELVTDSVYENLQLAVHYGRFPDAKYATEHEFVYNEAKERTYYVCDEAARAKQITFDMDNVQFIKGFETDIEYRLKGEPVTVNQGNWIGIEKDGDLQIVVTPHKDYSAQYFIPLLSDGDNDVRVNEQLSLFALNAPAEVYAAVYEQVYSPSVYTKITFDVLKNGRNVKQAKFISYTMEGVKVERAQTESIAIEKVDETPPNINWVLSNTAPTNKSVNAYISFNDTESGIAKVEEKNAQGNYVVINESEYAETNQIIRVINDRDDIKTIRVTNKAGLARVVDDISAPNIDKTPITKDVHYKIKYYYKNHEGEWVPIKEGNYYNSVKAVIEPTGVIIDGIKKELYIDNNNGSFEWILTNTVQSFTFDIRDTAGNRTEQTVEYNKYELEPPTIWHSIDPEAKTNQPITVTIYAEDNINSIAHCELYYRKDNQLIKIEGVKRTGSGDKLAEYKVDVTGSGQYEIHVWDEGGNKGIETFQITNYDDSPVILPDDGISYSIPPTVKTGQTVLVTFEYFNKPNVKVTGIDIVSGLTENDIVRGMDLRSVRFKKNGSVMVTFVDEYGNIGYRTVTVDNIKTTPPQCQGKYELADNKTYATIYFESMISDTGQILEPDLSQIYVVSGLINTAATVTADEARIRVNDNGTYNFALSDEVGNTQYLSVTVEGIDKEPPKVTGVKWDYDYLKEDPTTGEWETEIESGIDNNSTKDRYILSGDKLPETNQDVKVTVMTDKEITQIGSHDKTPKKEVTVKYSKNGVFSFNLEAINDTSVLYGVDVRLIDKEKPVIQFQNTDELIFIEGDTRPESKYDISKLYDFTAYDLRGGEPVEIPKDKVKIDFGRFNPYDINKNEFNRNSPYYITYEVADSVGNIVSATRTVRLIGLTDTVALINGSMPNANSMIALNGVDEFTVSLKNHSGKAYAKYMPGMYTMGEMKYVGKAVKQNPDGTFTIKVNSSGWYTVSVQTDKKDFFNIMVYMNLDGANN